LRESDGKVPGTQNAVNYDNFGQILDIITRITCPKKSAEINWQLTAHPSPFFTQFRHFERQSNRHWMLFDTEPSGSAII